MMLGKLLLYNAILHWLHCVIEFCQVSSRVFNRLSKKEISNFCRKIMSPLQTSAVLALTFFAGSLYGSTECQTLSLRI